MKRINLFDWATSELSQDAFLCWLLSWAGEEQKENDEALNKCACSFVKALLKKEDDYEIKTVEVYKQWKKIDVSALVNNEYFIVIEDKKGTSEHSNQLKRYADEAFKKYNKFKVKLVYFKMEEQGVYSNIEQAGYFLFTRNDMLEILNEAKSNNDILNDYHKKLIELNNEIESYNTLLIDEWSWYSWQGFYSNLQKYLLGSWIYVSNPSGGFLCFYWHKKYFKYEDNSFEFYLQLEQDKLMFKLHCENASIRKAVRDSYRNKLYEVAKKMEIEVTKHIAKGKWMGIAMLTNSYRMTKSNGTIDIDGTVKKLKKMQELLDNIAKELKETKEFKEVQE